MHDPRLEAIAASRADQVNGPSRSAGLVVHLLPPTRVRRALDLGSGCGVLSLAAARHADEVVAVDLNPRAVACTRLSAALSGCTNITVREGSWFEPVTGQAFDTIVANPPFVVSPDHDLLFRDSGSSDGLTGRLVMGVAAHLSPGGVAVLTAGWGRAADEPWSEKPAAWARDLRCDALALRVGDACPETYARSWNEGLPAAAYEAAVGRWLRHYRARGIARLVTAALVLRRPRNPAAPHGFLARRLHAYPQPGAGAVVARMLDGVARSAARTDEQLLGAELAAFPGARVDDAGDGRLLVSAQPSVGTPLRARPAVKELLDGRPHRLETPALVAAARRLLEHGLARVDA